MDRLDSQPLAAHQSRARASAHAHRRAQRVDGGDRDGRQYVLHWASDPGSGKGSINVASLVARSVRSSQTCVKAPNMVAVPEQSHAYLFANRHVNRLKALVHDGLGIWAGRAQSMCDTARISN
jgi:hypothetical protein